MDLTNDDLEWMDDGIWLRCGIFMSLRGSKSPLMDRCERRVQCAYDIPNNWTYFANSWICSECSKYFESQDKLHSENRRQSMARLMS